MSKDERSDAEIAALFAAQIMGGTLAAEASPGSRLGRIRTAEAALRDGSLDQSGYDRVLAAVRGEIMADMARIEAQRDA